jgi:hypothetical protein
MYSVCVCVCIYLTNNGKVSFFGIIKRVRTLEVGRWIFIERLVVLAYQNTSLFTLFYTRDKWDFYYLNWNNLWLSVLYWWGTNRLIDFNIHWFWLDFVGIIVSCPNWHRLLAGIRSFNVFLYICLYVCLPPFV